MDKDLKTLCGYVAIVGRPNVGKSTLLNRLLGQKLSITSRKPQTTRHSILGVKTIDSTQIIYVDTPGLHLKEVHAINKYMNKAAKNTLKDVDIIIFVLESFRFTEEDQMVFDLIEKMNKPVILVINKIDKILEKENLLPYLEEMSKKFPFRALVPISARSGKNILGLEKEIIKLLPMNPHFFPAGQITDRSARFRIAEIIREKVVRSLGEELPYATTVEIEMFKEEEKIYRISAIIWVERDAQKPIVIGEGGLRLKEIGTRARKDMEVYLNKKVHLRLWVKVKENWSDDERALKSWGYGDIQ
jgi:GTP-binding protein Era